MAKELTLTSAALENVNALSKIKILKAFSECKNDVTKATASFVNKISDLAYSDQSIRVRENAYRALWTVMRAKPELITAAIVQTVAISAISDKSSEVRIRAQLALKQSIDANPLNAKRALDVIEKSRGGNDSARQLMETMLGLHIVDDEAPVESAIRKAMTALRDPEPSIHKHAQRNLRNLVGSISFSDAGKLLAQIEDAYSDPSDLVRRVAQETTLDIVKAHKALISSGLVATLLNIGKNDPDRVVRYHAFANIGNCLDLRPHLTTMALGVGVATAALNDPETFVTKSSTFTLRNIIRRVNSNEVDASPGKSNLRTLAKYALDVAIPNMRSDVPSKRYNAHMIAETLLEIQPSLAERADVILLTRAATSGDENESAIALRSLGHVARNDHHLMYPATESMFAIPYASNIAKANLLKTMGVIVDACPELSDKALALVKLAVVDADADARAAGFDTLRMTIRGRPEKMTPGLTDAAQRAALNDTSDNIRLAAIRALTPHCAFSPLFDSSAMVTGLTKNLLQNPRDDIFSEARKFLLTAIKRDTDLGKMVIDIVHANRAKPGSWANRNCEKLISVALEGDPNLSIYLIDLRSAELRAAKEARLNDKSASKIPKSAKAPKRAERAKAIQLKKSALKN